jgi:hypothetical protein
VGHLPGVAGAQQVVAHDGQVDAVAPQLGPLGHHVGEAPLAQHPVHLDVGVGLGVEAPEQLEDQPLVVDHRRVRLLHHQRPGHLGGLLGGDHAQHVERQRRVDEGVVVDDVVDAPDGDALLAPQEVGLGVERPTTQHHLVLRDLAGRRQNVDHHPQEQGFLPVDLHRGDRHPLRGALVREPPLPRQEVVQQRRELLG